VGGILVPLRGLPDPAALLLKPPTRNNVVKPTLVYSTCSPVLTAWQFLFWNSNQIEIISSQPSGCRAC